MTTYTEARGNIKSGDIIAFSHYKWASIYDLQVQAVRLFTASEYCHVGVALVIGGRVFIVESVTPVVRLVPLSNFKDDGFYVIPTDTPMSEQELEFLLSKVGVSKYSKWQAIMAYLDKLEIGKDDVFQCAEFVWTARSISGLTLGDSVTPNRIVQAALEKGFQLKFIKG